MRRLRRRMAILVLWICLAPSLHAALYTAGVVSTTTLRDASRRREIPLLIYYPKSAQPERFPVIIFSHGAGGSRDGYDYLGRYWAEHGYVVIHPTHRGTDRSKLKTGRPLDNLKAIRGMMKDPDSFVQRPMDVSFILNSLPALAGTVPPLKDRMDPTRVGVGGHSLGAATALAVAGAVVWPPRQGRRAFGDNRPLAYLALSPQGANDEGGPFHSDSWSTVARPVLVVTGTKDRGFGGEPPLWRAEAFRGLKPGHKYLAVLKGAAHMDFSGVQLDGGILRSPIQRWVQKSTVLFWDAYLKRDPEALSRLKSGGWPKVDGVGVRVEKK